MGVAACCRGGVVMCYVGLCGVQMSCDMRVMMVVFTEPL